MTARLKNCLEDAGVSPRRALSVGSLVLSPLQPLLGMVVKRLAADNPGILSRLHVHQRTKFIIDPVDFPFVLFLWPRTDALLLEARPRSPLPPHDARIAGKFLHLVRLIDSEEDGDAMFFSRDLTISGDTEAIVTLRNALDDIEGSLVDRVADLLGPPGRLALVVIRRLGGWEPRKEKMR